MFQKSKNGIITLTRGDSFTTRFFINQGTPLNPILFDFEPGDVIYFRLFRANDSWDNPIVRKTYTDNDVTEDGYLTVSFNPEDTNWIKYGIYYYEAKILYTRDNENKVWTFIPRTKFYLTN